MRYITLATADGRGMSVAAYVYGDWAAHMRSWPDPGWRVTHVPTGLSTAELADDLSRGDAFAIAVSLGSRRISPRFVDTVRILPEDRQLIEAAHAEVLGG